MGKNAKERRPDIASISSGAELKRWYWLKSELVDRARELGLRTSGAKFAILARIANFLDTGETELSDESPPKVTSSFDWHGSPLDLSTVITDSYKNTQNVRRFFKIHAAPDFKFNIEFMAWMKANAGKTLGDAVQEYKQMRAREAEPGFKSVIKDHNQFNQYTRDFLADNPNMGMKDVRRVWALKRSLPSDSGRHIYERSDLDLK